MRVQGVWQPTIHASDLSRAYATAEALFTELGGTLTAQAGLREIHMGDWEGELYDDIQAAHPELSTRFWGGDPHAGAPGGETPVQVARRVHEFTLRHWPGAGETLILVSHGVAISALLAQLLNLDDRQAWASREIMHHNTAFTVLEVDADTREVHAAQIAQSPHLT
ncbi:histidine phosphatase family protein [Deinococcus antarcticus]|uniref:Histidine phosphatase family protein n=1 Tax=Deinococcus antarcticus TaxID=1298767 RepID=A0ABV8A635_9DEIO